MDCVSATAEDQVEVEELERFDDFTLASSWERFISEIEAVCRRWLADGPRNLLEKGATPVGTSKHLFKAKCELKYDKKSYCMEYFFEEKHNDKVMNWNCNLQELQHAFGVSEFLIIAPQSASGVVLDSPEASKLLSAVAIALSNCCSLWPAFVPVHDPSRKAHIGIQNMGTVFTRRFESDCIRSQVPVKLMHLEGLYELFVSKFAFSTLDFSMHLFRVQFTMKLTYRTLPKNDDDYMPEIEAESEKTKLSADTKGESVYKSQWDDDCPWSEWYSVEDPLTGFDLISIWSERTIESSLEMAEVENSSPHEAESWILHPTFSDVLNGDHKTKAVGFASQLSLLVDALEISFEAQFLEDFVSESNAENMKSSAAIPPPTVVDRVLKELFHEGVGIEDFDQSVHKSSRAIKGAPKGSLFTQFCLQSLWFGNCNIRAIAMLWIEFVREVRWCWEESQPLPKILADGIIDLSSCLVHQKLQMLAMCIERKREANAEFYDATEGKDEVPDGNENDDHFDQDLLHHSGSIGNMNDGTPSRARRVADARHHAESKKQSGMRVETTMNNMKFFNRNTNRVDGLLDTGEKGGVFNALEEAADRTRRGSAGVAGSMMLLSSHQRMHAPFTQDAPPMTEDMHEERLHAVAAFVDSVDSASSSAQLEREILLSDMSAFKAANPDAVFEDFIRWHSPRDWESDETENSGSSGIYVKDADWPPRGRLSKRMSEHGNFWRKLWNDAPALPAYEQKPLLDPNREGEKILHYLETLQPHQLLEQMVCTAFRASADTLNQTAFGDLNQMKTKFDQLYTTMASLLRPLQANQLSQDSEIFEDVKRLCLIFGNVERLTILAASLHRKFIRAPRLSKAIFSDFYSLYLPRMGNSSVNVHKEFDLKQQVRVDERHAVTDLFTPPSPNQSWRKVISMGNLLNGHEPVLREIIFTMRDDVSGNHYAGHSHSHSQGLLQEMETYRMYLRGTSDDLAVALSVVSCD